MNSDKKKIAVVVPKYGLVGGGERFVSELTERLATNPAYDIHVFANRWQAQSDSITFHKVPIITFPKWLTTISFAWFANKLIATLGGFDLIHAHDRIFRADICSMHFIPHRIWVKTIRGKRYLSLFDRATIWVEKKMLSNSGGCSYVLPVSSLAAGKLREEYPESRYNVQVIHPGVNNGFWVKNHEAGQQIREEFGIASTDFLLLFVSMNFELKGLDQLLAAMGKICGTRTDKSLKLLIVGKGNNKKYTAIAESYGLTDRVVFAGIRQDMPAIYQAADLFIFLSAFDTFGMVVTEAMAAGLPVIISDQVGAKDLVQDGRNGFIIDCEDQERLVEKIKELAATPNQIIFMGDKAREQAMKNCWVKVTSMVIDLYKEIL
ncbi:glycosyltransferase family 4 protein [Desulfobacterota bacterium M19]